MKNKVLSVLFSLCLILTVLLSVVDICCFDRSFYQDEHRKLTLYGTPLAEYIGTDDEGLDHMTDVVLDYLRDRDLTLDLQMPINGEVREIFTDDEKSHMEDVRNLYLGAMAVRNVCVVVGFISFVWLYFANKKDTFKLIYKSYGKTLIVVAVILSAIGVAIAVDFEAFWNSFHQLFFSNDLWLLDLRSDILIMIVPPQFFNDLVVRIFVSVVFTLLAFFGLFWFLQKRVHE